MTFKDILQKFRKESFSEKEKGTKFERLIKSWLLTDPRYADKLQKVWLWEEFPGRKDFGGKDVGIDLIAKTDMGDYWAIQCKCYDQNAVIDKPAVDSFLATSSRTFTDGETFTTARFSNRVWISTTAHWNSNAEQAIKNQEPPVTRIGLHEIESSPVEWDKLLDGIEGKNALQEGKRPMAHQLEAMAKAYAHYIDNERGKLIMACGTGKTYTSLKIVEQQTKGKGVILFMVPSIALLGQSLNAWMADKEYPIKAICICSDGKASRKTNTFDNDETSVVDLAVPATTNINSIKKQFRAYKDFDGLLVVFSTYQSIDVVADAQREIMEENNGFGEFDYIICDEAHRTTGFREKERDESSFTKIHNNNIIKGKKRLYMTATPRLYNDSTKASAKLKDITVWSMDNEDFYGEEFFRVGFGRAVRDGLLTDYKVLVLTVSEDDIPENILSDVKDTDKKELNFDDTTKLIGCINGLSKRIKGDNGTTKEADPLKMRRAVAFCQRIDMSKVQAAQFQILSQKYKESLPEKEKDDVVDITAQHIDGSMDSATRNEKISWLKEEINNPNECRILTNVRCLSEGVDVPALDAVLFVSARNSEVDVVQSVGRVMRTFRKGTPEEKKYGYIIVPVVVPADVSPEVAMQDNERFSVVWRILNALRAHDENFNATVNKIQLNKTKPPKIIIGGVGGVDINGDPQDGTNGGSNITDADIARQLEIRFGELQNGIYAKMVEKVGDRLYWESWAKDVGIIAQKFIERISKLVNIPGEHQSEFRKFVEGLHKNINPSVDDAQAIEMLAQHMITRPVFDALFKDYQFVTNNPISRSMQTMLELLEKQAVDQETETLNKFYESVRMNVGDIDNLEGKQTIIKNLYEKFFKGAFPKTVDKLGIVYTPIECVDFIIHSVNDILKKEFDRTISDENVHILDPFTGTGTFVTRLLQSGLIKSEDLVRKYQEEIHCNEIVLLAYYIADVNIESVFHNISKREEYLKYNGICLTDTFQLNERGDNDIFSTMFPENSERVEKQRKSPIRVVIGNPPYSAGQKSANDNAQNQSYEKLDKRISETYAQYTNATNKNSLYDAYMKAFRWSSDRISKNKEGGIVAFISNGAWLDGNASDGFRKCLENEFSSIYVLNLRGNQRTSGELSRKEGGKIFGSGSRTPISITILVKNPLHIGKANIYYHDIGDYLTRENKLKLVKQFKSISSNKIEWINLTPNEHGDWINLRNDVFSTFIPLGDKDDKKNKETFFQPNYCRGLETSRDSWCYNSNKEYLSSNIHKTIDFYNEQKDAYQSLLLKNGHSDTKDHISYDDKSISWSRAFINDLKNNKLKSFNDQSIVLSIYRPFFKQYLYFNREINNVVSSMDTFFPTPKHENYVICVSGIGGKKNNTAIISYIIPDLNCLDAGTQCFPLYWYEENKNPQGTLFDNADDNKYFRRDGVTDWIWKNIRARFGNTKAITKEVIFYYVYGILHNKEYRETFASDLKKSLPRIPIVDTIEEFMDFYKAGKDLAELHLNYESVPAYPKVKVTGTESGNFRVEKLRFPKKDKKDTIIYNSSICIENIPEKAYEYIVNGKSAIEWIMERYQVTTDKNSLIKNDPNDWAEEVGNPRYILDLLLSIINVSIQTVDIVDALPKLEFDQMDSDTDL
ncbi:DEAD/DEAH box helicase [Dysgonomonas sp. HDW5B]|uniref:DEAD/DEAH box helicase n=1 Tax=Dysgonomonas sp. HDW5B TaxID=2714927 RepID=UPI001409855A|nr:type ISP restriction/modification enzyme [Dysgonomonas sp. HDW5B]QIK53794.1 DEAD/DEAH box helicase [Dysgonomonas sp. HDW5B]